MVMRIGLWVGLGGVVAKLGWLGGR